MSAPESQALADRARRCMPGGVNSPVRSFGTVGGVPRFIDSAHGAWLRDADGRELIDMVGSWGAMIAGHAHPKVLEAIRVAADSGTSFGLCHRREIELAEEIIGRMPSIERVRMVNSGTEAVMSALRLARAATGRALIVRFKGCYHGHFDDILPGAGSGVSALGLTGEAGTAGRATILLAYNDTAGVESAFTDLGHEIAAVIVEPIAGNMGVVKPAPGFLEHLRAETKRHGTVLIFDEVITGFRVHRAGAQGLLDVTPDLTTLGKIIGGGLPVGAYGGTSALMDLVAPAGPVYQAGTLSGNPLAMAAGLATLRLLDAPAYEHLEQCSDRLARGLVSAGQGLLTVQRVGSMLTVFFGATDIHSFDQAMQADHTLFARFFHAMLDRGVHLPPSGYESWFVSLAHDAAIVDRVIENAARAMTAIRAQTCAAGIGDP